MYRCIYCTWFQKNQKSVIDYAIVSQSVFDVTHEFIIYEFGMFHLGSDHNMLILELNIISNKDNYKSVKTNKLYWDISKDQNWEPFKETIKQHLEDWDPQQLNENEAWNEWKLKVISAAKDTIGYKTNHGNCKVWFDKEIDESIKIRKNACKEHRCYSKTKHNPDFNEEICNSLWKDYQKKRNNCKSLIRNKIMQKRVERCSYLMEKGDLKHVIFGQN